MKKHTRTLLVSLAAIAALMGVMSASASAELVNAKFSAPSMKMSTAGLTLKKNGGEAKTCTFNSNPTGWTFEGGWSVKNSTFEALTNLTCTGTKGFQMLTYGIAQYDTVTGKYSLRLSASGSNLASPYGTYLQGYNPEGGGLRGTFTNGSGATPSTLTFEDEYIGGLIGSGLPLTLTGTITVTAAGGGLLTLSH